MGREPPPISWLARPAENHPLIEAAGARGQLPRWAHLGPDREAHSRRVAGLLDEWARKRGEEEAERVRWCAAGLLHDALKGSDPDELRIWAAGEWAEPLLHGPAIAGRLREAGVRDEGLLLALSYHSVGHPAFPPIGDYLYLADFLDPGRKARYARADALRDRLPAAPHAALLEVVPQRLRHLLDRRRAIVPDSIEYWNRLVREAEERPSP